MPPIDLSNVADLLLSGKAKARGEALDFLSARALKKLNIPEKQYLLLANALLQLLRSDKIVYLKSPSFPVEDRLKKAANFLQDLLAQMHSADIPVRFKLSWSLFSEIMALFPSGETGILEPCFGAFSSIIGQYLRQDLFLFYLLATNWVVVYEFLLRSVDAALDLSESLANQLLNALHSLLGGDSETSFLPFKLKRAYLPLLAILRRASGMYGKKENPVVISVFKISNKVLQCLPTEDFQFCHQVILLGLEVAARFASTSLEGLLLQMAIFFNHDALHRFISVKNLPSLTSMTPIDEQESALQNLSELIDGYFSRPVSPSLFLTSEDLGFHSAGKKDWFVKEHIFLKSQNHIPWLYASGMARLVRTFYHLRSSEEPERTQTDSLHNSREISELLEPNRKKQKVLEKADVKLFEEPVAFYNALIDLKDNRRSSLLALQALLLHLEHSPNAGNTSPHPTELVRNLVLIAHQKSDISFIAICCLLPLAESLKIQSGEVLLKRLILHIALAQISDARLWEPAVGVANCILRLIKTTKDQKTIIDTSLRASILAIFTQAESRGPAQLDESTFELWCLLVDSRDQLENWVFILRGINNWVLAHLRGVSFHFMKIMRLLGHFCGWLKGHEIDSSVFKRLPSRDKPLTLSSDIESSLKLSRYITNEAPLKDCEESIWHYRFPFRSGDPSMPIVDAIADDANSNNAYQLLVSLFAIVQMVEPLASYFGDLGQQTLLNWMTMTRELHDTFAFVAASIAIQLHSRKESLVSLSFPFAQVRMALISWAEKLVLVETNVTFLKSATWQKTEMILMEMGIPYFDPEVTFLMFELLYESESSTFERMSSSSNPATVVRLVKNTLEWPQLSEPKYVTHILRLLGNGPLSSQRYDRLKGLAVLCKLLGTIRPILGGAAAEIDKDCADFLDHLMKLVAKGATISEELSSLIWITLLENPIVIQSDKRKRHLWSLLTKLFDLFSQIMVARLPGPIRAGYLQGHDVLSRYNDIYECFGTPQASVEKGATFCTFLTSLSRNNQLLRLASIYNLLEFFAFDHMKIYLMSSLDIISKDSGCPSRSQLFRRSSLDLLVCWTKNGLSLREFPNDLFQYVSQSQFLLENYREVVAISLSLASVEDREGELMLSEIASLKGTSIDYLVQESFPLSIPLAFCAHGVGDKIFVKLPSLLNDLIRIPIQDQLPVIILFLIKFMDVSNEAAILEVLGMSQNTLLNSKIIVNTPGFTTISPQSTYTLIAKLIQKYGMAESFWSPPTAYFILRQLGVDSGSKSWHNTVTASRKIKFVLSIAGLPSSNEFDRLLISNASNYLDCGLFDDASALVNLLKVESWTADSVSNLLDALLVFIQRAMDCHLSLSHQVGSTFWSTFWRVLTIMQLLTTFAKLLCSCIRRIFEPTSSLEPQSVELFLNHEDFLALNEKAKMSTFKLLAGFVDDGSLTGQLIASAPLAFCLLSLDFTNFNQSFQVWIADILARSYVEGGVFNGPGTRTFERKPESVPEDGNENLLTLALQDFLLDSLKVCSPKDAAFLELALGQCQNLLGSSELGDETPKSGDHLIVLSEKSLSLMADVSELQEEEQELNDFLREFPYLLANSTFEVWTTRLALTLLSALPDEHGRSLIRLCLRRFSACADGLLPHIVKAFMDSQRFDFQPLFNLYDCFLREFDAKPLVQNVKLFEKMILPVTTEFKSRKNESVETFDFEKISILMQKAELSKSALMFAEDASSLREPKTYVKAHTAHLRQIYGSLNEDDILGIPEEPTFASALNRIGQTNQSSPYGTSKSIGNIADTQMPRQSNTFPNELIFPQLPPHLWANEDEIPQWARKLNQWMLPHSENGLKVGIDTFFQQASSRLSELLLVYEREAARVISGKNKLEDVDSKVQRIKGLEIMETLGILWSSLRILNAKWGEFENESQTFSKLTEWSETSTSHGPRNIFIARRLSYEILASRNNHDQIESEKSDPVWQGIALETFRDVNVLLGQKNPQEATNNLVYLYRLMSDHMPSGISKEKLLTLLNFHAAKAIWEESKTSFPVAMMEKFSSKIPTPFEFSGLNLSETLVEATLADWMSETRLDLSTSIMKNHVKPFIGGELQGSLIQNCRAYHLFGRFCERQFKSKALSDKIDLLEERIKQNREELSEIKGHYRERTATHMEKKSAEKYYARLKKQMNSAIEQLGTLKNLRVEFGRAAVKFYLKKLTIIDDEDEDIDRFFSLMLELSSDDELQMSLQDDVLNLTSSKILTWCTQLIARFSNEDTAFQSSLRSIVMKMCIDHPFHALYYLISVLLHAEIANKHSNVAMMSRVEIASLIFSDLLRQDSNYVSKMLVPVETHCREIILIAEMRPGKSRRLNLEKVKFGDYWLHRLPAIPPPTLEIAVSAHGYEGAVHMVSVDPEVKYATSGLSLPKILTFKLSDGTEHKSLFKHGTDDLRQDATMEQVFEKMNRLFMKTQETRNRDLRMRTYKAVPLGPRAGAIEFVPNTRAFVEVIKPFHQQHDQLRSDKAREMMKDCQADDPETRLAVYKDICHKIKPVLREYFSSKFTTPVSWYNSRTKYTRGMAAASMVGHVLGLGDRHCNNILLDEFTGEPVHIDFGVAFDQGRRLPIPETVPFRLTRDVVDGFGILGVKGSFSKLSECAFQVLRDHKDNILAILDLLKWDPLYSWSISPIRRTRIQEQNLGSRGIGAQEDGAESTFAIRTVIEKLDARELSVEAAVRELIQEATNERNLCLIYGGWCPFY